MKILDDNTTLRISLPAGEEKNPTVLLARSELTALFQRRFGKGQNGKELRVRFSLDDGISGYAVSTSEEALEFCGATPLQLLYAVYEFAEKQLDYCFFEPGTDTLASAGGSVALPSGVLFRSVQPRLKRRGFIQEFPFSPESLHLADWMAKNRMNYLLTWMKHYDTATSEILEAFQTRGIEIESGHHNFSYWIPGETYAASHPEFFAMRNGTRIKPSANDGALLLSEQLCTTNPDLRREIVNRMLAYAEKHPELKVLSLIPNDGFGWCECERCAQLYDTAVKGDMHSVSRHVYDASVIYHDLIADVSKQLEQRGSKLKLTFCAYVNYAKPAPGFRLSDNLAVHFAPYWRCVNHSIADCDCWINAGYGQDLAVWRAAKAGGEINIYEYLMGINLYVSLPMLCHETIFEEVAQYSKMGADGYLTQFHLPHWTAYGINYYMLAKALNGEERDISLNDFFQKIFGASADEARHFYAKMLALQKSAGLHLITYPRALFARTHISDYQEAHEMALRLAEGATHDFARRLPFWTEYLLRFKDLFDRHQRGEASRDDIEAFQNWCENLESQNVLICSKLRWLLSTWIKCLDEKREWLHFNIDWEDEYIRQHDQLLNSASLVNA